MINSTTIQNPVTIITNTKLKTIIITNTITILLLLAPQLQKHLDITTITTAATSLYSTPTPTKDNMICCGGNPLIT